MTRITVLLVLTILSVLFLLIGLLANALKTTGISGFLIVKEDTDGEKYLFLQIINEQSILNQDVIKLKIVKK